MAVEYDLMGFRIQLIAHGQTMFRFTGNAVTNLWMESLDMFGEFPPFNPGLPPSKDAHNLRPLDHVVDLLENIEWVPYRNMSYDSRPGRKMTSWDERAAIMDKEWKEMCKELRQLPLRLHRKGHERIRNTDGFGYVLKITAVEWPLPC